MFDIKDRTKKFAIEIVNLVKKFPKDTAGQEIGKQLIHSGTSIGANVEEADGASSRKDFIYKIYIACKEAKETKYWVDIVIASKILNNQVNIDCAKALSKEANELSKILYSIVNPKNKKINN